MQNKENTVKAAREKHHTIHSRRPIKVTAKDSSGALKAKRPWKIPPVDSDNHAQNSALTAWTERLSLIKTDPSHLSMSSHLPRRCLKSFRLKRKSDPSVRTLWCGKPGTTTKHCKVKNYFMAGPTLLSLTSRRERWPGEKQETLLCSKQAGGWL